MEASIGMEGRVHRIFVLPLLRTYLAGEKYTLAAACDGCRDGSGGRPAQKEHLGSGVPVGRHVRHDADPVQCVVSTGAPAIVNVITVAAVSKSDVVVGSSAATAAGGNVVAATASEGNAGAATLCMGRGPGGRTGLHAYGAPAADVVSSAVNSRVTGYFPLGVDLRTPACAGKEGKKTTVVDAANKEGMALKTSSACENHSDRMRLEALQRSLDLKGFWRQGREHRSSFAEAVANKPAFNPAADIPVVLFCENDLKILY